MIFVTGDTHGMTDYRKLELFAQSNPALTKADYVIIAGDCGIVWSGDTLDARISAYEDLPFSILFVDGNHENFDMLNEFDVENFCGGSVHRISEHIFHLMRGQVFELNGVRLFAFGGAESTDKIYRQEGVSWWKQEIPSAAEIEEGLRSLAACGNKVDCIITHSCDRRALYYPPLLKWGGNRVSAENMLLSVFEDVAQYNHWYFGHYHLDGNLTDKKTVVYNDIIKLN